MNAEIFNREARKQGLEWSRSNVALNEVLFSQELL
jgi:hypothetical protein